MGYGVYWPDLSPEDDVLCSGQTKNYTVALHSLDAQKRGFVGCQYIHVASIDARDWMDSFRGSQSEAISDPMLNLYLELQDSGRWNTLEEQWCN